MDAVPCGIVQVLSERDEVVPYLRRRLSEVAARQGERLLDTPANPISMALTLDTLAAASVSAVAAAATIGKGNEDNAGDAEAAADGAVELPQEGGAAADGVTTAPVPPAPEARRPPDVTFFGSMLWSR